METPLTLIQWNIEKFEESEFFKQVYMISFPEDERREWNDLKNIIVQKKQFIPYIIYEEQKMVGIITTWILGEFIYIEHFAVHPERRSAGIGFRAMENLKQKLRTPIVLEVEKPETEIAKRRINFYTRLDFKLHERTYIQPAYGEGKKPIELYLMSYNYSKFEQQFDQIVKLIHTEVYDVKS